MWTIFKVFIEFATILLLFYGLLLWVFFFFFFFFSATRHEGSYFPDRG